jgi:hypothetical protein
MKTRDITIIIIVLVVIIGGGLYYAYAQQGSMASVGTATTTAVTSSSTPATATSDDTATPTGTVTTVTTVTQTSTATSSGPVTSHPFIPAGGPITISGTTTCLPPKNTTGPQDTSCALGFKDVRGNYYALVDTDPTYKNVSGVANGSNVTVTGTFTLGTNLTYNIVGTIAVTSITKQ